MAVNKKHNSPVAIARNGLRFVIISLLLAAVALSLGIASFLRPSAPLRVVSLKVDHWENSPGGDTSRGLLGEGSFETVVEDAVRVSVKLSDAAYCYLIAYNPDGKEQLCYPEDAAMAPPKTRDVKFPEDQLSGFGLTDGVGLQAFVVLASREPLPAYADWSARHSKNSWSKTQAEGVWHFDGNKVEPLGASASTHRGPVRRLRSPEPFTDLCEDLSSRPEFTAIEAIAFPVLEKR